MEVRIVKSTGLKNDLLVRIDRGELEAALLHIARRDRLRELPGMPRHRPMTDEERQANRGCKVPMQEHLAALGLLDADGRPRRRFLAVGNRNLGNNHGVVAWQAGLAPPFFHIADDPLDYPPAGASKGRLSVLAGSKGTSEFLHDAPLHGSVG